MHYSKRRKEEKYKNNNMVVVTVGGLLNFVRMYWMSMDTNLVTYKEKPSLLPGLEYFTNTGAELKLPPAWMLR